MKSYYVYILKCADKFLYTGITNNVSRRFIEHQQGLNKTYFTFKRRPVELIFYQEFNDVNQAIFFEKKIKNWSRNKKLALANSDFDALQILSECKNETHSKNIGLDSARPDILDFNEIFKSESQKIHLPILEEKKIELFIKREDCIHPQVSGNKFRKLKYNIEQAKKQNQKTILTFGGAFSNHIVATAIAGKLNGLKTIGVIRGEELGVDLEKTLEQNETLQNAHNNGMDFYFVTRTQYREKNNAAFLKELKNIFGDFYLIPEGGSNELAVKGCEEILTNEDKIFDYICVPVGTGGTIAGLINTAKTNQKILGFPALKGNFLESEISKFTQKKLNWELITAYHFGGYGKYSPELIRWMNAFFKETGVLLDPIYTGKMLFGIVDLIEQNYFAVHSKILAIHTGGIQGIDGFNSLLRQKNQQQITIL